MSGVLVQGGGSDSEFRRMVTVFEAVPATPSDEIPSTLVRVRRCGVPRGPLDLRVGDARARASLAPSQTEVQDAGK